MEPDYIVLGGRGVEKLDALPPNCKRGDNDHAFVGGFRLWDPGWGPRPPGAQASRETAEL